MKTTQKDTYCENCLYFPPIGVNKVPCSVCNNNDKFESKKRKKKLNLKRTEVASLELERGVIPNN